MEPIEGIKVGDLKEAVAALDQQLVTDIETYLQSQPQPELVFWWFQKGGHISPVPSLARLTELVAALRGPGQFGLVERVDGIPWAQTMSVPQGWIVEVDGRGMTAAERFAQRVRRVVSEPGKDAQVGDGKPRVIYYPEEVVSSAAEVARIMWFWLHLRLPGGYEHRRLDPDND